ncbi:dihydrolipoyl dehydrogenase family protein [Haliovirga abyssi]|uniref:Dihydrolipoyl dehydrogenase n=1 Tax=Haliovirga abyssi TaxID=2996794 RepID=A0AAU9E0M1_9FUSO|nr:NAD(P)/FAD-dependent oxidoreductase [Haliovirga abyssi]BDU49875.1 dihydrolipoyl dehydrogenase [Haliovirga abyssi]
MKKFDAIVIGMGPAGMAVSAMGAAMGLDILAVEKRKVGGECLNCGCIPSKALLKAGEANQIAQNLKKYGINAKVFTDTKETLGIVREKVGRINGKKMMKAFEKVTLLLNEGSAEFVNKNTIKVNGKEYSAKKIFIGTGTEPFIPPIPGVETLTEQNMLTNLNIFEQENIPATLTIIGGGAIGTEMAQAFSRLGSKINLIQMDEHLLPAGDKDAGILLEKKFKKENIGVYNSTKIEKIEVKDNIIYTHTSNGVFEAEKILIATGRKPVLEELKLENAGIKYNRKGILIDEYMRTNIKNIYAIGDCNGYALLSHAAMHQGMLALMNAINPLPLKFKRSKYFVPWSVFTKPEVAQVGLTEKAAKNKNLKYIVIKKDFSSYGRTVADGQPDGFIKVITNKKGKIYGVTIIGEAASEMIHEWILAIQKNLTMFDILMTQHSFPTISMLNKMVAEDWMMEKMNSTFLQKVIKFFI